MRSQILTFYSTHHALAAEKLLKTNGIEQTVIPTPRELSGNCGIALKVPGKYVDAATQLLEEAGIEVEAMHTAKT